MAVTPPRTALNTTGKINETQLKPSDVVDPASVNSEGLYIYDLISEVEHRIGVQALVVQQNIDSKWNESYTFGKMDPISTYQSTQRSFQIGFVTAGNAYITINTLTQLMYPSFVKSFGASSTTGATAAAAAKQRFGLVFNVPIVKLFHSTFLYDFNSARTSDVKTDNGQTSIAKPCGLLGYIKNLKIEVLNGGFRYPTVEYFDLGGRSTNLGNDTQKYKISFDFIPLHQNLLDRQNENFRKLFPYPTSYDTKTDVSTDTAVLRLQNAKLNEFFTFQSSTLTSTQPTSTAPAPAPAPGTDTSTPLSGSGSTNKNQPKPPPPP